MSSPQDKVVTVKLRFVSDDADARRSLRQQADDAKKLADATDRVNKGRGGKGQPSVGQLADQFMDRMRQQEAVKVELVRRGALPGPAAPRSLADRAGDIAGQAAERRQLEELLRVRGLDARGDPLKPLKARLSGEDRYAQQAAEVMGRRRDQAGFERHMAERGLTPTGERLPVERGMIGRGLEAAGGRLGLPAGMAGRVGPYAALAAPAVVGKMALDQYAQARQIDATPFLTPLAAEDAKSRSLPLGLGRAYGAAVDTMAAVNGDLDARRASAESRTLVGERIRLTGQAELGRDAYETQVSQARNRADAMSTLSLDKRAGFDQTTVKGQQQYDLETKMLPARRALTIAAKERAAAEKNLADAVGKQAEREIDLADARKEYDKADREYSKAGGRPQDVDDARSGLRSVAGQVAGDFARGGAIGVAGGLLDRAGDMAGRQTRYDARATDAENAKKALDAAQEKANQARGNTDANQRALAEANSKVRKSEIALTQVDLADARERVGESQAGARQLGGMSRGSFQEAKVALKLVQKRGAGNVDEETLALAESVAPETVGKMKEEAGASRQAELRKIAPDEKRFADLGEAREKVKGLEEKERTQVDDDIKKSADDAAKGLQETGKIILDSFNSISAAVSTLKRQMEMMARNGAVHN